MTHATDDPMVNQEISLDESETKSSIHPSLADRIESSPRLVLLLFTVVYAIGATCNNLRRPLWFDEIFTSLLADLPSIRQIWPLIGQGIELNPPLPFWIIWVVHHTLGSGEVLSRLPAVVGYWGMCVCLFHFVRRRSDNVHGLFALVLPLAAYTFFDGTWARGYGIMLGCSAAALLCWQLALDGVRRRWSLPGLALGLAGAVSCHYYALYVVGAIGLGELVRSFSRRRIDMAIWIAVGVGVAPLFAYASLIKAASGRLKHFWAEPSGLLLYDSYADLLGPLTVVILLLMALTLRKISGENDRPRWRPATLGSHEVAAVSAFAAMPVVVFAAGCVLPVVAYPYYLQPVVIGSTVLTAMFAYRIGGNNKVFRQRVAFSLVWLCLAPWFLWQVSKLGVTPKPGLTSLRKIDFALAAGVPVVVDSDEYLVMYHYASRDLRDRIYTLLDHPAALEFLGTDTDLRSFQVGQTIRELHVRDYHEFIREHREFLVLRTAPAGYIVQKLLADGAELTLESYKKGYGYNVTDENLLFRVNLPPFR